MAYTIYTIKMYYANKEAADAAKSAADTAAKQLEMSERPWVSAEIKVASPFEFEPINNTMRITFEIAMKNTGHSPALNVGYEIRFAEKIGTRSLSA